MSQIVFHITVLLCLSNIYIHMYQQPLLPWPQNRHTKELYIVLLKYHGQPRNVFSVCSNHIGPFNSFPPANVRKAIRTKREGP